MIKRYYKNKSILPNDLKKGRFRMAVTVKHLESLHEKYTKVDKIEESVSIKEIESVLGLNKIRPIILSPSDEQDVIEKGDNFKDWYEDELRKIYEAN